MIYIFFGVFIITVLVMSILTASGKVHGTSTLAKILKSMLWGILLLAVIGKIIHSIIPHGPVVSKETFGFNGWEVTNGEIKILSIDREKTLFLDLKDKIKVEVGEEFPVPEVEAITYDNTVWAILFFEPKTKSETIIRFTDNTEYGIFKSLR